MRMRLPSLSTSSCLHRARASSVSPAALIACISGIAGLSALVLAALFGIAILLILVPPVTTAGAGILQIIAATIFVYVASNIPRLLSMRTARIQRRRNRAPKETSDRTSPAGHFVCSRDDPR
jgi:hypothetical protein